jgi:mycoredoxin
VTEPTDPATAPRTSEGRADHGEPVTVYWRPGCGFCGSLLRGLERSGLAFERVDIWRDEDGAAFVRSVADGNETVPTVRVADIALVNPSTLDVLREVRDRAPEHLPPDTQIPEGSRLGRAIVRLLGG